jgi:hypothetical protein
MGMRRIAWIIISLVIGVLLVTPMPETGRELRSLSDLAHAPVFGLLSLAFLHGTRKLLPTRPFLAVLMSWAIVVLFGGSVELIQGLTSRTPGWFDALANALGAGAFLIWSSTPTAAPTHVRFAMMGTCAVLLAIPSLPPILVLFDSAIQAWSRPLLASLEGDLELSRWEFGDYSATRSLEHSTDGSWSLRVVLDKGKYAGVTFAWPVHDWSAHSYLEFDVYLEPGPPMDLVVKIEDQEQNGRYEDRFHRLERLEPGPHHIRIPLSEVERAPKGRNIDLRRIRRLEFFTETQPRPFTLFLDIIRLR